MRTWWREIWTKFQRGYDLGLSLINTMREVQELHTKATTKASNRKKTESSEWEIIDVAVL